MDVYVGRDTRTGTLKIIKGPYLTRPDVVLRNAARKLNNGLYTIPVQIESWIPDRWLTETPLGNRNRLDRTKPAFFLVFDALLTESQILHRRIHSSKLWPPTEVLDLGPDIHVSMTPPLTDSEMCEYVHALLFRFVVGISDLADRNFLRIEGRILSIDEELEDREVNFVRELRLARCGIVSTWIRGAGWEQLLVNIARWSLKDCGKDAMKRLAQIQTRENVLELFQELKTAF